MTEFEEIIDDIEELSYESQEILIDIINKRFSERKRALFIEETLKSKAEYENGNFETGNSENLFKALQI